MKLQSRSGFSRIDPHQIEDRSKQVRNLDQFIGYPGLNDIGARGKERHMNPPLVERALGRGKTTRRGLVNLVRSPVISEDNDIGSILIHGSKKASNLRIKSFQHPDI